jgi:hypothetical protein
MMPCIMLLQWLLVKLTGYNWIKTALIKCQFSFFPPQNEFGHDFVSHQSVYKQKCTTELSVVAMTKYSTYEADLADNCYH